MAASAGSSPDSLGAPGEPAVGAGGEPPALSTEEIARRLQSTRQELSNRRKILLRNLPAESSSQVGGEEAEVAAGQSKARGPGGGERREPEGWWGPHEPSGNSLAPSERFALEFPQVPSMKIDVWAL